MPIDVQNAINALEAIWQEVLENEPVAVDERIDRLVNSSQVSVRYALPTQLLGKLVAPELDALCLQKGEGDNESMWDPRGFASKVIVPWVSANQNVLGTSGDPYVSKPLRRPQIEADPKSIKKPEEWKTLHDVLREVQDAADPEFTRLKLKETLTSIRKKLAESTFEFHVPPRVSLAQALKLIEDFLSEASGGDRGLALASALFEVIGKHFGLYSEVRRAAINASDTSTGLTADIECIGLDDRVRLAVEVKERALTLQDVRTGASKARASELQEFLFNAPRVATGDTEAIKELVERTWASGTNLYHLSIFELAKVVLSISGEDGRRELVVFVGEQLNKFNTQPSNRLRWKELIDNI